MEAAVGEEGRKGWQLKAVCKGRIWAAHTTAGLIEIDDGVTGPVRKKEQQEEQCLLHCTGGQVLSCLCLTVLPWNLRVSGFLLLLCLQLPSSSSLFSPVIYSAIKTGIIFRLREKNQSWDFVNTLISNRFDEEESENFSVCVCSILGPYMVGLTSNHTRRWATFYKHKQTWK